MAVEKVVYENVPQNEKIPESPTTHKPNGFGVRHLQTILILFSLIMAFTMRSQLSVLMVAMASTNGIDNCHINNTDNMTRVVNGENCQNISSWGVFRSYDWNKSTQEIILFAFFVGYTSMQLPMGLIAQKFGGKKPIMFALIINGVLSILMPWCALFGGWIGTSISRLLQGMTQAAFYPSIHTLLAKWAPVSERGRFTTYCYTGSQIGTIIAFQLSGLLAGSPALGWPVSFWLFGALGLIVCGLFSWLGAASPHEHPSITSEELAYILEGCNADVVPKKRKTPWREILKSKAVWGLLCTQAGSTGAYLVILTEIPIYMTNILGVDIKRNGLYSSLPYIAMSAMSMLFGTLADFARNRNIMKVVNIRRTANTIGMMGSGLFLIAFSFVSNTLLAIILLILTMALHSGIFVGFLINQIDLAPNFAGPLMALGNMTANITGLLVPVVVSSIVKDVKNQWQWQIVFIIFAAIQCATNAIFVIFAKGEVQPWNYYGEEETELEKELHLIEEKKTKKENEC